MLRLRWFQVGGGTRGKPRRDLARRKSWPALGLAACLALLQSGCQSGPFSNCGSGSGLFSPCGFFGRVSSRVFNRSSRSAECCEPGVVSGAPVEYQSPSSVMSGPVVPSYQATPGSSISSPSTVPALPPETPAELNPVDKPPTSRITPGSGANGTSSLPSSAKTSYQTRRVDPNSRLARRPVNLSRAQVSTPEPTSRSAQALSRPGTSGSSDADNQDPLDHLPPLDLPGEVTSSAATPPVPPAADRGAKPAENASTKADVRREAPAPAADDLDLTSSITPAAQPASSTSVGPGINRFVAVDLKLAGGSAPSTEGLKWLADKGYRTVLDLRESAEVPASFIAQVTGMGLRYLALPIGKNTIDRDHVDRFNFEMAAGEARPLFFFDSDGTRAGALWYIRRITHDRVDRQIARREAQELGLADNSYWAAAATNYVDRLGAPQTTGAPPAATPGSTEAGVSLNGQKPGGTPENSAGAPAGPRQSSQTSASSAPTAGSAQSAVTGDTPDRQAAAPPSSPTGPTGLAESVAWRPFAAMVLTGLTVPLAYWSRTLPPAIMSRARASLAGPAHRPKSLPVESGA